LPVRFVAQLLPLLQHGLNLSKNGVRDAPHEVAAKLQRGASGRKALRLRSPSARRLAPTGRQPLPPAAAPAATLAVDAATRCVPVRVTVASALLRRA
jgi:hypothetical protein